mmetsp:Transcript_16850/g.45219  ORF Transcript_16850/g.45219 Transcript_16850/m.45219 type:complete len:126 (+) Transcript_16850:1355-1732(+)
MSAPYPPIRSSTTLKPRPALQASSSTSFFFACSPILTLFSSAISAVVAARRVALFGATMSATCAKMILKLAEVVAQGQGELSEEQVLEIVKAVGGKYEKRTDALEKMTKEDLTKEIEELCCESEE